MQALVQRIRLAIRPHRSVRHAINTAREIARANGGCNPVGANNGKTGLPGTYNRVGQSCPGDCPWFDNGCYAQKGNVALAQRVQTAVERLRQP